MKTAESLLPGITVNTHSSVRISAGETIVYVDPFRLEAERHDADIIFVTHDHFDHFSPEDIAKVLKPETVFVLPPSTAETGAEVLRGHRVLRVAPNEQLEIGGLRVQTVPAYNPGKRFHPKKNNWVGYILSLDGVRVYIAGDTDATEEAAAVRCSIAMLPIGGKYTMDPEEAAALANRIRPEIAIPIHYGSVAGTPADFDRFAAAVDPAIRVVRLV